jgi:DNA-binding MarR family transcriptional regulator/catechol 2,3-dioxygenase-like lactoylglutathione lyase family enzyme
MLPRNEFATPALLRLARDTYTQAIRAQLLEAGVDDLPRNGGIILAGIDIAGGPRPDLPGELGVTKQAVSQLIDVLVSRGYLERGADPGDRRRIALDLTSQGREVVEAIRRGVGEVDRQLHERLPAEQVEAMCAALTTLAEIRAAGLPAGTAIRRPRRQLRRFSPIFGVRDLAAALEHYASLGFRTSAYDEADYYGFADRDGTGLHLARHGSELHPGATYLYVRDADALYEEWSRPGIGGHTHPAGPTGYGLREGSHTDPDGNLIRFGSPIQEGPIQEGPIQEGPIQEWPAGE